MDLRIGAVGFSRNFIFYNCLFYFTHRHSYRCNNCDILTPVLIECYTTRTSTMSQSTNRNEPWRANERHYCAACNSWMGSDRQSILIHENGKKHRENVELNLVSRREEKLRIEKDNNKLETSLQQMEKAAAEAMSRDVASGIGNVSSYHTSQFSAVSNDKGVAVSGPPASKSSAINKKHVIESWEGRRKGREKNELTSGGDGQPDGGKKRKLGPDEGFYTVGETTYLEGKYEINVTLPDFD